MQPFSFSKSHELKMLTITTNSFLQEVFVHLKGVIKLVDKGGLRKWKRVVVSALAST